MLFVFVVLALLRVAMALPGPGHAAASCAVLLASLFTPARPAHGVSLWPFRHPRAPPGEGEGDCVRSKFSQPLALDAETNLQ